jgi:hypothetical protein
MPVGIMTISTETTPELHALRDHPEDFYHYVKTVITKAGAELIGLFFDVGEERAYVLVEGLDEYVTVKAVSRILGGEGFLKMVRFEQLAEAIDLEPSLRPDS